MSESVVLEEFGVKADVNISALSDMDVIEALYDIQDKAGGNPAEVVYPTIRLARGIFGKDQWGRIKSELRCADSDEPHVSLCLAFAMKAVEAAAKAKGGDAKNSTCLHG